MHSDFTRLIDRKVGCLLSVEHQNEGDEMKLEHNEYTMVNSAATADRREEIKSDY